MYVSASMNYGLIFFVRLKVTKRILVVSINVAAVALNRKTLVMTYFTLVFIKCI